MANRNPFILRTILALMLVSALLWSAAAPAFAVEEASDAAAGGALTPEAVEAFLDAFFTGEHVQPLYTGAGIVLVKDGAVLTQRGYGYANREEQTAVDPAATVFRTASVSKTFTAVAVMQLAEQGQLELEADIRAYLPDLDFHNPYETPVTIEHLLTHRSGFEVREPRPEDLHTDYDSYTAIGDYVRQYMPPVVREPGDSYMYDNFAYLLLGLIVEEVSGEPYEHYMDHYIFKPLGMENSGFVLNGPMLEQLAVGYDAAYEPIDPYVFRPTIMPHGGMLSTVEDMGRFMLAFLNGGAAEEGRILEEASVEAMNEYRSAIHPLMPETTYGFEAAVQLPQAGSPAAVLTKLGDLPGNSSLLLFIPEQDLGIFLTYNQTGVLRDLFYSEFLSAFFPEYAAPAGLEPFGPSSPEELADYEGFYTDLRLSSLVYQITAGPEEGTLTIRDALLGSRPLYQVDVGLFLDAMTQRYTAFRVDETNGTVYMKESYLNPLGYAKQGVQPAGFADVDETNAYLPYMLALQSLGHYSNDAREPFGPEQPATRAELVHLLLAISGLQGSASEDYAFEDIDGHARAPYIQAAAEYGIVNGNGDGRFAPDRAVTRQEAAVMVWNVYRQLYPDELFAGIALQGNTDEWAVSAVKMAVALGLHGPEVQPGEEGADYLSLHELTRAEAAAFLFQLLLQPVNQIVYQLMQSQS